MDLALSALGLVLAAPLLVVIAVLVRITSSGPALYRHQRVGFEGRLFDVLKFRTMVRDADKAGPAITSATDLRVTPVGRWLRWLKLDEVPQLWNVFKGEMSLVGPRPELPVFVALYTPSQMSVLSVRPGITDPASIAYRHEELILAGELDPERHYRERLLPQKLVLSLHYVKTLRFRSDVSILCQTLVSLFRIPSARVSF